MENKFYGQQVYLSVKDKETLWNLVDQSSLSLEMKDRLKKKIEGEYLCTRTWEIAEETRKRNLSRWQTVGR